MSIEECHDDERRPFKDNTLNEIKSYLVEIIFSLADGRVDSCGFILVQDSFWRRFGMMSFVDGKGWKNIIAGLEIAVEINVEDREVIGEHDVVNLIY